MRKIIVSLLALLVVAAGGLLGYFSAELTASPQDRHITIKARQYAFEPPIIKVNKGDKVYLKLITKDCIHGFYLEGYDIDAKILPEYSKVKLSRPSKPNDPPEDVEEIIFVAAKEGKFRYRCSITCGSMHPFMLGEMIVSPNRPFRAGIGLAVGLIIALFMMLGIKNTSKGKF